MCWNRPLLVTDTPHPGGSVVEEDQKNVETIVARPEGWVESPKEIPGSSAGTSQDATTVKDLTRWAGRAHRVFFLPPISFVLPSVSGHTGYIWIAARSAVSPPFSQDCLYEQ